MEAPPTTSSSTPTPSLDERQVVSSRLTAQAKKHLVDFSIATNDRYEPNWHHEVIARELEHIEAFGDRDYKILMVFVPPRHGKSQECSIDFPAWFLGRNPSEEIMTASYSADLSHEFGSLTRDKVNSDLYKAIFPNIRLKEDEKSKGSWKIEQRNEKDKWEARGGSYTSVGVGGSATGKGAKIFLIDDPTKNRQEAESEVHQASIYKWYTSVAFTRLAPKGVMVLITTRWALNDLAGQILRNPNQRIKIIHFPAIATKREVFRDEGEALWPQRFDLNALNEIKDTVGPYDWESLYQGSPVLTERQEFKPEWWKKVPEMQVEAMNCTRFLTVDTAISKASSADFTGFCDNRVNSENFWFFKAWRMRLGAEELIDALFALHTRHHYDKIGIEKTVYLDGLKPYLDEKQRQRNIFLPIVELKHNQTQKEVRIRGLIPRYASGSIFHIEGETAALEEEMMQFPQGLHDDVLDAAAYQLQITSEENRGQVVVHTLDYSM